MHLSEIVGCNCNFRDTIAQSSGPPKPRIGSDARLGQQASIRFVPVGVDHVLALIDGRRDGAEGIREIIGVNPTGLFAGDLAVFREIIGDWHVGLPTAPLYEELSGSIRQTRQKSKEIVLFSAAFHHEPMSGESFREVDRRPAVARQPRAT
jgi:hypothetical protein